MPRPTKLQRWTDLLAALLVRHYPATFDELRRDVPGYLVPGKSDSALMRMFERDKDELRAFGIPIETVERTDGAPGAYRLRPRDFYLPYLYMATPAPGGAARPVVRPTAPTRVNRWGYQALAALAFEPDELAAVGAAARRVRQLGDPLLAAEAESATRKLAADLPLDAAAGDGAAAEATLLAPRRRGDPAVFESLGDAVSRRKVVRFDYHALSTGRTERRTVEPYGLFFLGAQWYLVGRDQDRGELRNFRLSRVSAPAVNAARAQSPDFEVPADFRLRDHARSRQAWELGDGDATEVVVEVRARTGAAATAATLGAPVAGSTTRRLFRVRRPEPFVRWLLSFGGDVVPVSPAEIVEAYGEQVRRTIGVYEGARVERGRESAAGGQPNAAPQANPSTRGGPPPKNEFTAQSADAQHQIPATGSNSSPATSRPAPTAATQLRRVLHVIPRLADDEPHAIAELAGAIGVDVPTLRQDIFAIAAEREDEPAGFVQGVQVGVEGDHVWLASNHFRRPMRLTVSELCALELGLAMLGVERPPAERPASERARERLRAVIARLPGEPIPDGPRHASLGSAAEAAPAGPHLAPIRAALRGRRALRLAYQKGDATNASERVVRPYALVAASGMLYLVAHCERSDGLRVFRLDRVEGAELLDGRFEVPASFSVEAVLRDGKAFRAEQQTPAMRVRYGPTSARWIAEREGGAPGADGSLVVEHPLADVDWAVRHVLQYGPDAEVLEPEGVREALRTRLLAMSGQATQGSDETT